MRIDIFLRGKPMDPYEILGEIGNGSFGKIHKVRRKNDNMACHRAPVCSS